MAAARELKVFAVLVNLLIMAIGAALVGVGVYAILDNHGMIQLNRIDSDGVYTDGSTPGPLDVAAIMAIVTGVLSFFMGVDGIFSVCREWRWMLALYIGGMIVVLLLEVAILITTVIFTYRIDDHLYNATYQAIKNQYEGHIITDNHFSKAFDEAQVEFECCGLDNYTDFKQFSQTWLDIDSLQVPKSCCKIDKSTYFDNDQYIFPYIDCARAPTVETAHLDKACFTDIKDWLERIAYMLMGIAITGAGALLLGILVTACLIHDVGVSKEKETF